MSAGGIYRNYHNNHVRDRMGEDDYCYIWHNFSWLRFYFCEDKSSSMDSSGCHSCGVVAAAESAPKAAAAVVSDCQEILTHPAHPPHHTYLTDNIVDPL